MQKFGRKFERPMALDIAPSVSPSACSLHSKHIFLIWEKPVDKWDFRWPRVLGMFSIDVVLLKK